MKKLLILALAAMLLLAGCGKAPASADTPAETTTVTEEVTEPQGTGVYFVSRQTYFDSSDTERATLTVTLNEAGLPETVFMDSGADITYTPTYDAQGNVTAFTGIYSVYGEDTVYYSEVNDHGDIVKRITEQGTEDEKTFLMTYAYDEQGRIVKEETTRNGESYTLQLTEYDEQGSKSRYEEINYTSPDMSYVSVYTNTYENGLLTETECAVDGIHDSATTYAYDDQGRLTEECTDNGWVTTYVYNDAGQLAEKTITINGIESYRYEYSYDENGNKTEEKTYISGEFSGRFVCVWEEFTFQPTDAQLNVFKTFSIINK